MCIVHLFLLKLHRKARMNDSKNAKIDDDWKMEPCENIFYICTITLIKAQYNCFNKLLIYSVLVTQTTTFSLTKYIWPTCWGTWAVFSTAGAMFLTCTVGVVNWTACPVGTADTRFTLGAMCRMPETDPAGAAIVNWGAVPVCTFVKDEVATLMGTNFWSCTGIVCLLGELPVLGAMCCLFVNGCTWTKVHVILPVELEFVCAPVRAAPPLDKGVSLMGLPEMTTKGGFDWAAVVIVLATVVAIVVAVKKSQSNRQVTTL